MWKKERGITLIALVVTIVVLIILAGISISVLMGDDGGIRQARKGKEVTEIAAEKEAVKLAAVGAVGKETYGMLTESSESKLKKELDKYIGQNQYDLDYDMNKSQFKVTYKESGRMYYVDAEGTLQGDTVIFVYAPTAWTNESTTVTIAETTKLHQIQYKTEKSGKSGEVEDWTDYSEPIVLVRNQKIYVRLMDKANGEITATGEGKTDSELVGTVSNIDKLSPSVVKLETTKTTNKITVSAVAQDAETTSDYGESGLTGYRFSKDGGANWTDWQESGGYVFENLTQTTKYNIKVQAKDLVGNIGEKSADTTTDTVPAADGNIKFAADKTGCTNGNVTVTATSTASSVFTLEVKTNKDNWAKGNTKTFTTNGTMYGRLKDSTGQVGKEGSYNVVNIDKLAPNSFTLKESHDTTSITITASTSDRAKTNDYCSSGIDGYRFSINNGGSWTAWQKGTQYKFSNLDRTKEYYAKVEAKDYAGNTTQTPSVKVIALYVISFNSNGGTSYSARYINDGGNYGSLPSPSRSTCHFAGWYTGNNGTGTKVESNSRLAINGNHTLYAKWTATTACTRRPVAHPIGNTTTLGRWKDSSHKDHQEWSTRNCIFGNGCTKGVYTQYRFYGYWDCNNQWIATVTTAYDICKGCRERTSVKNVQGYGRKEGTTACSVCQNYRGCGFSHN